MIVVVRAEGCQLLLGPILRRFEIDVVDQNDDQHQPPALRVVARDQHDRHRDGARKRDKRQWDVVLHIDGTYTGEIVATREDMVRYFTDWLKAVLRNEDGS
jgi:hypothetical protein